jgi:hypothetical protein
MCKFFLCLLRMEITENVKSLNKTYQGISPVCGKPCSGESNTIRISQSSTVSMCRLISISEPITGIYSAVQRPSGGSKDLLCLLSLCPAGLVRSDRLLHRPLGEYSRHERTAELLEVDSGYFNGNRYYWNPDAYGH